MSKCQKYNIQQVFHNKLTNKQSEKLQKFLDGEDALGDEIGKTGSAKVCSFERGKVIRVGSWLDIRSEKSGYHQWISEVVLPSQRVRACPKVFYHAIVKSEKGEEMPVTIMERLYHKSKLAEAVCNDYCLWDYKFSSYSGVTKIAKNMYRSANKLMQRAKEKSLICEDLHPYNVMFRKDGMLVITDPSA